MKDPFSHDSLQAFSGSQRNRKGCGQGDVFFCFLDLARGDSVGSGLERTTHLPLTWARILVRYPLTSFRWGGGGGGVGVGGGGGGGDSQPLLR